MVVLLDTSAVFAIADRRDPNHQEAVRRMAAAGEGGDQLLVHSYVILEAVALMSRRLGWEPTHRFLADTDKFQIRWVDEGLHRAAVKRFVERQGRVSLVDEVSFLVMRESGARHALAFDKDFWSEGFLSYPAS